VVVAGGVGVLGAGPIAVRVTGGAGVTGSGLGATDTEDVVAAWARAWRVGRRALAFPRGAAGVRAGAGAEVLVGANCEVTDNGSPARPMRVAANCVADQATVAVAAIPSSAALTHNNVRRFTVRASYLASG
jgi:hypothetical protein